MILSLSSSDPHPATAGCSLQKPTGLFALSLTTPSRGWHVAST